MRKLTFITTLVASLCLAGGAFAQDNDRTFGNGTPPDELPEPTSDNDPRPEAPAPESPEPDVIEQAGIGGSTAYARQGVLELGGSLGLTATSEVQTYTISPSIGWFVMDNLQFSALLGTDIISPDEGDNEVLFSALLEPSVHLPVSDAVFLFGGVGAGVASTNEETGFAVAPRAGANFMVGRSGILTPSVKYVVSAVDAETTNGETVVGLDDSLSMNVGYTVMW